MGDRGEKVILDSLFAEVGYEHAGDYDDVVNYDVSVSFDDVASFVSFEDVEHEFGEVSVEVSLSPRCSVQAKLEKLI